VIPQISLILGPVRRRRGVFSPALTDFVTIMVDDTSNMFLTGPDIMQDSVTGEDVTAAGAGRRGWCTTGAPRAWRR
jgi:propionyl-CoA carboxylase beta chain